MAQDRGLESSICEGTTDRNCGDRKKTQDNMSALKV